MFAVLFKQKDNPADLIYAAALTSARDPVFYTDYGVPDTFDGRFDLLLVHIFIHLHVMIKNPDYPKLSQKVFDITFRNMDQTLREMGIGDMGVPKHMKRMMKAFNGRMHAYQDAMEGKQNLKDVLRRNLYGTVQNIESETIKKMSDYVIMQIKERK